MKKIVILGCENSHANHFLKAIKEEYRDVEVVGIYSDEPEASKKLNEEFDAPIMNSFDEAAGKIDGVVITARHGDNHYKYAKPYIESGIPMFIDKPITCNGEEAVSFMQELKAAGVKITGGSSLRQAEVIKKLRREREENAGGETLGGFVKAPIQNKSVYGGFYFYAQHLVEMVLEVFGRYPKSIKAFSAKNEHKTVVFRYENYDVTALYTENSYTYHAIRVATEENGGGAVSLDGCFEAEFREFYDLLSGGEQVMSYEDFIAPVFVMDAIEESLKSGEEVLVKEYRV
jgi:predicted dehydrogenase